MLLVKPSDQGRNTIQSLPLVLEGSRNSVMAIPHLRTVLGPQDLSQLTRNRAFNS